MPHTLTPQEVIQLKERMEEAAVSETAIKFVDKLSHSQIGLTAAYRAGLPLQEKGLMLYPAASWDAPAFLAFSGDQCIGGLNFSENENDLTISIDFAWCDPAHPKVLTILLLHFRKRYRESKFHQIKFVAHAENQAMAKCAAMFRLAPYTLSYRLPIERLGVLA